MIQAVNPLTKDDQVQIQTEAHHASYEGVAAKWIGGGS